MFNQFDVVLISKLYNIITKKKDFRTPDNGGPSNKDYNSGFNIGISDNNTGKMDMFEDKDIKILHFKGKYKPWNDHKGRKIHKKKFLDLWDKYKII